MLFGLICHSGISFAEEQEAQEAQEVQEQQQIQNEEIEEVVVEGSRLQGSAQAVLQERKDQAFVADILGTDQISRTGDSDAASALRRITGLTLVDGKFIYVRGLGERYSSVRLNGAAIPSPDLTRNVIPLDIIPASIIQTLAVQKAFSPSMPAAFGGGSIDVRTKAVPTEFVAGIEVGVGQNSAADNGLTFNRGSEGVPSLLTNAIPRYRGDFSIDNIIQRDNLTDGTTTAVQQATQINRSLLKSLPRNFMLKQESLDPNYDLEAYLGNNFSEDWLGGEIGFLASISYDTSWDAGEKRTAVLSQDASADCSESLNTVADISSSCYNTVRDSFVTTETERLNAVINLGYKNGSNEVTWNNLYIEDNEQESDVGITQSPAGSNVFSIVGNGRADRSHELSYEERRLTVSQLLGKHTFTDFWGIGVDWQYTRSNAKTDIPTDVNFRFIDNFENLQYTGSSITGDNNRVIYSFTEMDDRLNSWGGNISLPLYFSNFEIELKSGYDAYDRGRNYATSSFQVSTLGSPNITINDGSRSPLTNGGYLSNSFIDSNNIQLLFNEPTVPDADDYIAAQQLTAVYGAFDIFYKGTWRFSGGLRWEEFKQNSIGTSSLIFDEEDLNTIFSQDRIEAGTLVEDDIYPALSMTFVQPKYQIRFGYGETVVRPDLREVVPVTYFDPLTDIRTFGRVGLGSSPIKNYDLRYEYYTDNGDNYSVAAFYKDIQAPIETILRVGDADYSATFLNGDSAEVYGVEFEWLHDMTYLTDGFFASGNITLSDSEAVIPEALAGNITNPSKRLTGHSKYVVNLQLNYDSSNGEHSGSLVYNVFGERIIASGVSGRDDAFEQPFHSLDLVYKYYPDYNSTVSFKIKNLLGEDQEVRQSGVLVRSQEIGTTYSASYKYDF